MSPTARWVRGAIVVVALVAAFAAGQGAASAVVEVTGATLEGASSVSTPPGGVMQAEVTAKVTPGATWRGTR